ncbi:MAG: 50S ribosomal protein L21 [Caldiserica bacterium]|nr:50S ribosomal protein L21 [Caldisericota bacterium]
MKAVIGTGGKQYIVEEGEIIEIERVGVPTGKKVEFKEVFALGEEGNMKYGNPILKGVKVEGEVLEEIKGDKKISFKYRKKTDAHWKKGHRQILTRVKITSIVDVEKKEK